MELMEVGLLCILVREIIHNHNIFKNCLYTGQAVASLAVMFTLTVVGIVVAVSVYVVIFFIKKRKTQQSTTSTGM